MAKVFVFGASGYSGLELVQILARHPHVELVAASSDRWAGQRVSDAAPLVGGDLEFQRHDDVARVAREAGTGVAFLATPNESSAQLAPPLLDVLHR